MGNSLVKETSQANFCFRKQWLDDLIEFYKTNKGKSIIHLTDLPDNICIKLNKDGNKVLQRICGRLKINSRAIKYYFADNSRFTRLGTLKKFMSSYDITKLEKFIIEIKSTKSGYGKPVQNPKFPVNLNSKFGAILLGNFPDAAIKTGSFGSKDIEILNELMEVTKEDLGDTSPNLWKKGKYYHLEISSLIKYFYSLSGLNTKRQIISNNAIPSWAFSAPKSFKKVLLRKIWDCEGSAPVDRKMCLGQSVVLGKSLGAIPNYPKRTAAHKHKEYSYVLSSPPRLLVSLQLLMHEFGIISFIKPHRLYKRKNGMVVCDWHLLITRHENIKKFYDEIGFDLKRKQEKLKRCIETYTKFPKIPEKREDELTTLMNEFKAFTIKDLQEKTNLTAGGLRNYLTKMRKEGKIEKIRNLPQARSSFLNEYRLVRCSNGKGVSTK